MMNKWFYELGTGCVTIIFCNNMDKGGRDAEIKVKTITDKLTTVVLLQNIDEW